MNEPTQSMFDGERSVSQLPATSPSEEAAKVFGILKRQKRRIVYAVLISTGLAVVYLAQAVTRYTSTAAVLIDSKLAGLSATTPMEETLIFETGAVDSQVLLLQSDRMAERVIQHLDLTHNQSFLQPPTSVIGAIFGGVRRGVGKFATLLGANPALEYDAMPPDLQRNVVVEQLQDDLKVTRNARTYVLTIAYTSYDPGLARTIAAAYAAAYLEDQLESRFETSRRASAWLEDRIQEVKRKADAAERIAQDFRVRNRLTEASGRLINEQALTDINAQLSQARNDLNVVKSKYDRLKQIVESQAYDGSSLDALSSPIISSLRAKYLDAFKMNSDISARLGPQHESAVRARKEMNEYAKVMFQEVSRLLESYQSEVQIASGRVASLEQAIEQTRTASDVDSVAMGKLKTLENETLTYKNIYTIYLQKAQDLIQQQSIPISNARVIADAELPTRSSSPKTLLILLVSVFLGGIGGGCWAMVREFRERGFRVSSQIRDELGLDFTCYLPRLTEDAFLQRAALDTERTGTFKSTLKALDITIEDATSQFSESLRSIRLAVDYHFGMKRPLKLGVISVFPNEGKSTIAKNLASLIARQGESVLLMDCDLRNPQLTRSLTPTARIGLLETLNGSDYAAEDAIVHEESSGLAFFPACARGRVPATGDLLSSPAMARLVQELQQKYSYIIFDLAPLGPVKDASAAATFLDAFHLVIEWGATPRGAVADALATDPAVAARVVGVTLSKVELDKLELFEAHSMYGYASSYNYRYYHTPLAAASETPRIRSWRDRMREILQWRGKAAN
ncbi:GNVR domain-containing protein [Rhodoblastus acidophilus]|nr:GNVR domain-containing protein [Rhodoblastus acidophilus]PPQ38802.1 hypothetical protein CKO16_09340 [Rhodoblastus acidophilus]RAI20456.1 hypothetical protein CH337_09570 [Rhodoblastus acidophilus]